MVKLKQDGKMSEAIKYLKELGGEVEDKGSKVILRYPGHNSLSVGKQTVTPFTAYKWILSIEKENGKPKKKQAISFQDLTPVPKPQLQLDSQEDVYKAIGTPQNPYRATESLYRGSGHSAGPVRVEDEVMKAAISVIETQVSKHGHDYISKQGLSMAITKRIGRVDQDHKAEITAELEKSGVLIPADPIDTGTRVMNRWYIHPRVVSGEVRIPAAIADPACLEKRDHPQCNPKPKTAPKPVRKPSSFAEKLFALTSPDNLLRDLLERDRLDDVATALVGATHEEILNALRIAQELWLAGDS